MDDLLNYLEDIPEYSRRKEAILKNFNLGMSLLLLNAFSARPRTEEEMREILWGRPQVVTHKCVTCPQK